jgi:DNA-binding beta-propeller fold protein YncE
MTMTAALVALPAAAGAAGPTFYISDFGSSPNAISAFTLDGSGNLAALPGSPFVIGPTGPEPDGIESLAFVPEGVGVVGYDVAGGLQVVGTKADGTLETLSKPYDTAPVNDIAFSPDGNSLYVTTANTTAPKTGIHAYGFGENPLEGIFGSGEYRDVAITPDGRFLYATNSESIQTFAVVGDGSLTPIGKLEVEGPRRLEVSPDGRLLFVEVQDQVVSYVIGADGSLTPGAFPNAVGDSALSPFAVSPDGTHLYLAGGGASEEVSTFTVGAAGEFHLAGETHETQIGSLAVSPDGRDLFFASFAGQAGVGVMPIGTDGVPTPGIPVAGWSSDESEAIVLRPSTTMPVAHFAATAAASGSATTFDASGSSGAARYEWNFGDGTTLIDGGARPSHVYAAPGTYTATLTVFDEAGCSSRFIYFGASAICPADPAAVTTRTIQVAAAPSPPGQAAPAAPVLGPLRSTHKRFALKPAHGSHAKRGTTFRYDLSEPAKVTFTITRHGAKKPLGTLVRAEAGGAERTPFSGHLGKVALEPGRYRATAVAVDAAGQRSAPRSVAFRIVPN